MEIFFSSKSLLKGLSRLDYFLNILVSLDKTQEPFFGPVNKGHSTSSLIKNMFSQLVSRKLNWSELESILFKRVTFLKQGTQKFK